MPADERIVEQIESLTSRAALAITEYLEIRSSPKVRVRATTSRPRGYNDADDAVDECQLGYGGSPAEHDRFLDHCARSADLGQPAGRQCGRICRADHIGCQDREQAP